jgi:hypothetical protein
MIQLLSDQLSRRRRICCAAAVVIAGAVLCAQHGHVVSGGDIRDKQAYPQLSKFIVTSGTATDASSPSNFVVSDGNAGAIKYAGFHGDLRRGLSFEITADFWPTRST